MSVDTNNALARRSYPGQGVQQAGQERFWEPRTLQQLALQLLTAVEILAADLPEVQKAVKAWIVWVRSGGTHGVDTDFLPRISSIARGNVSTITFYKLSRCIGENMEHVRMPLS